MDEQIVRLRIGITELLAFHTAVGEKYFIDTSIQTPGVTEYQQHDGDPS